MESCYWCSTCSEMFECGSAHHDHDVKQIGGANVTETITSLDEMITFGLTRLEKREGEVAQAKEVKDDIEGLRVKFKDNSQARIERIVKDLRVEMEYSSGQLLKEVNKKVGDMELKCQSVITTSRVKMESIKGFIQVAALTLPDEESGHLEPRQLNKLYAYYKTVNKMENQPRPRISYVDCNIKYPDSYERKKECRKLADNVSGHVERPQRKSFLHDPLPEEDDELSELADIVVPLRKPRRKESRDMLRN